MAYSKNEKVYVRSVRRWGVVAAVLKTGQYRVQVEALEVICSERDLSKESPNKKQDKANHYKPLKQNHPNLKPVRNSRSLERLDLHGMTVAEAISAVNRRIDQAIIADIDRVEIIHGIGTGRLMTALHKYLSSLSVVSSYKMDSVNPGVTWVYF